MHCHRQLIKLFDDCAPAWRRPSHQREPRARSHTGQTAGSLVHAPNTTSRVKPCDRQRSIATAGFISVRESTHRIFTTAGGMARRKQAQPRPCYLHIGKLIKTVIQSFACLFTLVLRNPTEIDLRPINRKQSSSDAQTQEGHRREQRENEHFLYVFRQGAGGSTRY